MFHVSGKLQAAHVFERGDEVRSGDNSHVDFLLPLNLELKSRKTNFVVVVRVDEVAEGLEVVDNTVSVSHEHPFPGLASKDPRMSVVRFDFPPEKDLIILMVL